MRILFLSSEVAPWSKTGGLADVAQALPYALAEAGHDVRVMTPRYGSVSVPEAKPEGRPFELHFPFGHGTVSLRSVQRREGCTVSFIEAAPFADRDGLYMDGQKDYPDNAHRFTLFTIAALTGAQALGFEPDIVHCNDWQTGLAPLALRRAYAPVWPRAKSVLTIHNLAYQGVFPKHELERVGISQSDFTVEGVEYYGHLSFMKAGLCFANALTTVSPSYAQEIQTKAFGMGMEGVISTRVKDLSGILNGLDTREWNPATDVRLPARFSAHDLLGRGVCRQALLGRTKLDPPSPGMPIYGAVGRMVDQKGADLMLAALPAFIEAGARVVVLGSGAAKYENGWRALAARFPRAVHVTVGFDDSLAHLIHAGSDYFVMPSRFEPCGLTQLYALAYGALPIVHSVGGLRDTVVDASLPEGTGLTFNKASVDALRVALERSVALLRDAPTFAKVRARAMAQDFSWSRAAKAYGEVYRRLRPDC